jgi:hypothetical protein
MRSGSALPRPSRGIDKCKEVSRSERQATARVGMVKAPPDDGAAHVSGRGSAGRGYPGGDQLVRAHGKYRRAPEGGRAPSSPFSAHCLVPQSALTTGHVGDVAPLAQLPSVSTAPSCRRSNR